MNHKKTNYLYKTFVDISSNKPDLFKWFSVGEMKIVL